MRILIVEDEYKLADVIAARLKREKYLVDIATNGTDGLDYALSDSYDLIILDVMLPGMNGFAILKELRESKIHSKVIMLTAKSQLEDKLTGFSSGADDYLTKPFHLEELLARVNVQLRRDNDLKISDSIAAGDLKLMIHDCRLICTTTNEAIDLAGKEYQLIEYFLSNPGQVMSRDQIYNRVWGLDNEIESNNLEAYLSFLRKKLRVIGSNTRIKAVRGMGYRLEYAENDEAA
jgi:DNA-binding response OmpR family regulator